MAELLKKVKHNKRIVFITLSVVFFCIITISLLLLNRPTADDIVSEFEAAVRQGNEDTLKEMIKSEDKDVEITDKTVEQLIAYVKDEPSYLRDTIFIMKGQAAILDKDHSKLQNDIFKVATDGEILGAGDYYLSKSKGLFSTYHIYARPYSLEISTDQPKAIIKINDKKVLATKRGNLDTKISHLAPGTYTVSGLKKYKYATINNKQEVNLFEKSKFKDSVELELTGKKVAIESTVENVSVFINNKNSGKKASLIEEGLFGESKYQEPKFGPFSNDGSIKVYGEISYPWGSVRSKPQAIKDEENIDVTPNPFDENSVKDQVIKTVNNFAQQRIQALVKEDSSLIKTASDSIIKEYTEEIQNNKYVESYWKGKALGTTIDFGTVSIINKNEEYEVTLPVRFHDYKKEYNGFNDDDPLEEEYNDQILIMKYLEKSNTWVVSKVDTDYSYNEDGMEGKDAVKSNF